MAVMSNSRASLSLFKFLLIRFIDDKIRNEKIAGPMKVKMLVGNKNKFVLNKCISPAVPTSASVAAQVCNTAGASRGLRAVHCVQPVLKSLKGQCNDRKKSVKIEMSMNICVWGGQTIYCMTFTPSHLSKY